MDLPVDEQVARDAEEDEGVDSRVEEDGRQQPLRKTAERCGGQRARRDEDQPAVDLRLAPPEHGQREGAREGDHVEERDHQLGFRGRGVELDLVEPAHRESGRGAQHDDRRAQRRPEPARATVPADLPRPHRARTGERRTRASRRTRPRAGRGSAVAGSPGESGCGRS